MSCQKDFPGTLAQVKEMGYDGVELAGLCGYSPEQVKKMCEEAGLVPISAHVPLAEMSADPEKTMKDYAGMGCRYIAIPYLTEEFRPGAEGYDSFKKEACRLGELANANGMTLLYHNHDFEFAKKDGEYLLDIMYRDIPASLLQTEQDILLGKGFRSRSRRLYPQIFRPGAHRASQRFLQIRKCRCFLRADRPGRRTAGKERGRNL